MTPVRQSVAVVTGAARGGGRGIALALGRHAGTVVLVGRSTREHPNRLLRELGALPVHDTGGV